MGDRRDVAGLSGDPRNPWWELRVIWLLAQQRRDDDPPNRLLEKAA